MDNKKWRIETFRSHGFLNRDDDMGRVYVDLPIIEAKRLLDCLGRNQRISVSDMQAALKAQREACAKAVYKCFYELEQFGFNEVRDNVLNAKVEE